MSPFAHFRSVWIVDVAVAGEPGEQLDPVAIAAIDVGAGCTTEIRAPKLSSVRRPPYPIGPQSLLVCIDGVEVIGCHLALGWRVPERIIDLMVEFRNLTNGRRPAVGGLAGALLWFDQPAARGFISGTSPNEMQRRLQAVAALLAAMQSSIDFGRALLRGRYLCAVASIDATGVPVERCRVESIASHLQATRDRAIATVDQASRVHTGLRLEPDAFKSCRKWTSCRLDRTAVFSEKARAHAHVLPLKELRTTLAGFDPGALTIGHDGRNRTPLRPFASRTSRNQPSTKASVLGTAAWVRHFIKPEPGTGLAMVDWDHQEFGIAAALSGDEAMQNAYTSSDPYLALAIYANAAPADATAETHPQARDRFKACALGVQYGMGSVRLARLLRLSEVAANGLLSAHRSAFPRFWTWSDAIETHAVLHREIQTVFGWRLAVGVDANLRSVRNFPMQANGAEMLRLACCLATESGIKVCAAIHDALLIQAPLAEIDAAVARTQSLMAEASAVVLDGFALRTSVRIVRAPDLWTDDRGQAVWSAIRTILNSEIEPSCKRDATCSSARPRPILLSHKKSVS